MALNTQVELIADNLCRNFGSRRALAGVSLAVSSGQTLAVSGSNGSGKSTLLRILAGLLTPTRGSTWVAMDNRKLHSHERWSLVSLAAPAIEPYHHLTLLENLEFAATSDKSEKPADCVGLAEMVGLSPRGNDLVGSFSSGMIQRTRLALALVTRPAVLLLDEPTHTLDEAGRELVAHIVSRQRERGICVIATNDKRDFELATHRLALDSTSR